MALRDLNIPLMIELVDPWLDPGHEAHAILEASPAASPLLILVAAVRLALIEHRPAPDEEASQLAALAAAAQDADGRHDRWIRGVIGVALGMAELAEADGRDGEAEALRSLAAHLFPDGLRMTQATYLTQAGAVEQLAARLGETERAALEAIALPWGGSLAQAVDGVIAAGRELGQIERERDHLTRVAAGKKPPSGGVLATRNRWIQLVHAVDNALRLEGIEPAKLEVVMGRIEVEARRARAPRVVKVVSEASEPVEEAPEPSIP